MEVITGHPSCHRLAGKLKLKWGFLDTVNICSLKQLVIRPIREEEVLVLRIYSVRHLMERDTLSCASEQ